MNQRALHVAIVMLCVALAALYQFAPLMQRQSTSDFDLKTFGELPAAHNGRVLPLDSVARNSLLILSNRQSVVHDAIKTSATQWLLELIAKPDRSADVRVFRIDHPEVRVVMNLSQSDQKRFTFREIMAAREELERQARLALQTPDQQRNLFQRKILQLDQQVSLYQSLGGIFNLNVVPPPDSDDTQNWLPLHAARFATQPELQREIASLYGLAFAHYGADDADSFNQAIAQLRERLASAAPQFTTKAAHEAHFNLMEVFSRALVHYVAVILLVFASWLVGRNWISRAAIAVLLFAFAMHTAGIVIRVYLSGRPPVTNLYSSALFVGWGSVLLCIVLERLFRNGMGALTGAIIGFLTLMVAQSLSSDGDTMAVLQAVLDTNFWLATHVVVITLGYASTYLAGFLGIAFIIRAILNSSFTTADAKRISQMIYGIICFATLFSFLGTILGGIWADQSWGRFWGWDPKENGAMIIVLWNALILHARWGGLVKYRGLAALAIFGNIVTSWSWFGVNMLGRGLHSYGFMESAAFWLLVFVASQLALIAVSLIPKRLWRSTMNELVPKSI